MDTTIDPYVAKLRKAGLRITPQRLAILAILDGNTSHPSALEVFNLVAKDYPAIALATVYNTLDALSKNGMLRELPITKEKVNYDPDTSEHDHAYCAKCGRIFDIFSADESAAGVPRSGVMEGASLISVRKIYYIECKDCRKKEERRGRARG
jgi:Fur family transcriptional regulator, peroxide stress response regulator